jgi:hypothetical protein
VLTCESGLQKKVVDNKFIMRFPSAKMVLDHSNFKLGVRSMDAQMLIEPWNSAVGAKGKLQLAWFKVRGIPPYQRSIRTIAKIRGLVGKTMEIDEKTRFNQEFVRLKIACRDVSLVPESAESTLGVYIYDFFFELEEQEKVKNKEQKIAEKVPVEQPSPKKPRMEGEAPGGSGAKNKDGGANVEASG